MALFTGKGDSGTTKIFGCNQKISKSSAIAEALGSLDEINSFLGLCKVQSKYLDYQFRGRGLWEIVHDIQKNLFIVQAEMAGADKSVTENKVKEMEEIIDGIEKTMSPIKSFFISGGSPEISEDQIGGAGLGSLFDIARTIARRAERRAVAVSEEFTNQSLFEKDDEKKAVESKEDRQIDKNTLAYLNRLSSILYALARYSNYLAGIKEEAPDYS